MLVVFDAASFDYSLGKLSMRRSGSTRCGGSERRAPDPSGNEMCRILAYIGPELPLESLLLTPENSLINQSLDPELHPHLQLAGWGVRRLERTSS